MFRRALGALTLAACLSPSAPAAAQFRVWEVNAPVDPTAPPPEPEQQTTTTTTTTTNPDGTTSTTTTTTTTTPHAPEHHERQPFLDDYRWLEVTGFVQPGYIQRLDNASEGISPGATDDTFWLQRARLGLRAQLFDWLRVRVEFDMTTSFSLQDAFVDITPVDWLQVRVGQMIVPFLQTYRYNEVNIGFLDRAIYVPNAPDRGYMAYFRPRDIGIQISGTIGDLSPSAGTPVFQYQLGMFNGRGVNVALNDDGVFLYAARLSLYVLGVPVGVDRETDLSRNHIPRVTVGAAAYSNCDDRQNWNRGFTTDFEVRYEGLFVEGAFFWMRNGASGTPNPVPMGGPVGLQGQHDDFFLASSNGCQGVPDGGSTPGPSGTVVPTTLDYVSRGANVQVQYVLPRFLTDLPFSLMDFELLFRADYVDGNSPYTSGDPLFGGGPGSVGYQQPVDYTNTDNPPTRWRLTFGINYYPTGQQQVRLGINYQLNREAENVVSGGRTFAAVSNDIFWLQMTLGL
jgi:hypothetical protein